VKLFSLYSFINFFLKDARKTIKKFINKKFRELAMWCIALLINTSTWNEFKHIWQLICLVFLQLHLGEEYVNQEHQDTLLNKISRIKSDSNTADAIKSSDCVEDENGEETSDLGPYDFYDDEEEGVVEPRGRLSGSTRKKVR